MNWNLKEVLKLLRHAKILGVCDFPKYYPELSSERILTMDWMQGMHLSEFAKTDFQANLGNRLGQALWNFYMFQIHGLKKVHADPHPGNFLVGEGENLIAIDFGCIKEIPEAFYKPYFEMATPECLNDELLFEEKMYELEILMPTDSKEELKFFKNLFKEMLTVFTSPFHTEEFDFGSEEFWGKIGDLSQRYANDQQIRKMNANRGSKHFIYMNRTFFGLFNLLYDLKAKVIVNDFERYLK